MTAESRDLVRPRDGQVAWPVRSGSVPSLADGFSARPETAPGLRAALIPGTAVALAPGSAMEGSRDWLGTCGKTQLAVQYAESLWQSGGVELLVWVVATSREAVLSAYAEAATAMGTDAVGDAESMAARFVSWLATTARSWLVVLDDLSDTADLEGLWPEGPSGRLLITAANSKTVSARSRTLVLPVGVLSSREALSYLMGRLTADPDQRIGAIDLITDLGCEPLALAQATGVIASSTLSCRDYQGYFLRRRDQLAQTTSGEPPAAASVTWTFSVEQADRLSPDGAIQSVLALAALLDGHAIPSAVFATSAVSEYLTARGADGAAGPGRARDALLALERAALLALDEAARPAMIRMSPVIQAAVRAAMPTAMLDRAVRAAADALTQVWPGDEQPTWLATAMRSCAASLQQAAGDLLWAGGCHPLLLRAGRSLDSARMTAPAVAYWTELAAASDRILGSGHPDTLAAGERLASAYLTAGRASEAAAWFQWVVAKRVRTLGADHPGTMPARRNLGAALVAANQLDEAVAVLDAAAADYERIRGREHPDTLSARDELAAAHRAAGQFAEAIRLGRVTLADRERLQGARHPDAMTTRHNLAGAYLAEGRLKDAISQYKRALADRERVLGQHHLDTIAARASLGSAYHAAGKIASALQLYEQAGTAYERVLGADHPDTLARRADLANAYYTAGRLTDAATLLRDTVARCERVLAPGDPLTRAARDSLANISGGG